MDRLVLVRAQIKEIEDTCAEKIAQETPAWHHAMVGKLATIPELDFVQKSLTSTSRKFRLWRFLPELAQGVK